MWAKIMYIDYGKECGHMYIMTNHGQVFIIYSGA